MEGKSYEHHSLDCERHRSWLVDRSDHEGQRLWRDWRPGNWFDRRIGQIIVAVVGGVVLVAIIRLLRRL